MGMAYPEAVCLCDQMPKALVGKEIADVSVVDISEVEGSWRFGSIDQSPIVKFSVEGGSCYVCPGLPAGLAE